MVSDADKWSLESGGFIFHLSSFIFHALLDRPPTPRKAKDAHAWEKQRAKGASKVDIQSGVDADHLMIIDAED